MGLAFRDSIPGKGRGLFSSPHRPDRLWVPPSILFDACRDGKVAGTWSYLPSSSSEDKNEWSCTSPPIYAFVAWTGKKFTLFLMNQLKHDHWCRECMELYLHSNIRLHGVDREKIYIIFNELVKTWSLVQRVHGAVPPLQYMPSWRGQGKKITFF